MLLHLPIIVLATLSPVAVSDTVPKLDIVRECRFEGESTVARFSPFWMRSTCDAAS
jgi:hypothetical protein